MSDQTHVRCPYKDCGSSDAFSWNHDGYGKCHSCAQPYPTKGMGDVFDWVPTTYPLKKRINAMTAEITGTTYKGIRGLDEDVSKLFGIQVQTSEGNVPVRYAYKYPHTIKYRDYNDKAKTWIKDRGVGMLELFGPDFNSGSSKRLYLTEGEFDAASLYQILGKTFPVKAIPSASIGEKFIKHNHAYLTNFQEIVYAGELDDAGRKAADKLYEAYPDKFYFVPMSQHKDANDFLTNKDGDVLKWAALKPQRYSPDNFFCSDDAVEKAIREENPYEYIPTGHAALDGMCRGLVKGGITFIKAPRGTGKTEIIRYFEAALLRTETAVVALLHMEEMKSITYRAMATYELGINVRTKDDAEWNNISEDEVLVAAKKATQAERTIIFEMRSHDDPLKLLDYVRLAATAYGADFVFVDHVQRLAYLSDSGVDGATSTLTTLGSRMAQLAKELNIGVIFISQVNDDGRTKYAASLEEEAIICIKLERDVETDDEILKNTTGLFVDKNRCFAKIGKAGGVYYDPKTTILEESEYPEAL